MSALGLRAPETIPHALRHPHHGHAGGRYAGVVASKRLGHASPESVKVYTRVSEEAVLAEYAQALESKRWPPSPW